MKTTTLKISALSAAIMAAAPVMAGGFDNSDRSMSILFGEDNVITTSYGQTHVPMQATVEQRAGSNVTVQSGKVVDDFIRPEVAIRYNLNQDIVCATKFEKPFAASVAYKDDALSYNDAQGAESAPISTNYQSESLTFACGYDVALSTGEIKLFAGPKLQNLKGSFDEDLTPNATGTSDNLIVELNGGTEVGYIFGAAYSIPEIALRASLTYHSQVDYDATGTVTASVPGQLAFKTAATANTFTPQSLELAFQSGIAENTLAFVKMRWSEYSKLESLNVQGDQSTVVNGADLSQYILQTGGKGGLVDKLVNPEVSMFSNDTLDYTLGLGRRINDKLTLGASFSGGIKLGNKPSDTPLGADSTSLRLPGDTTHTLAFGGEYSVMPGLKINGGFGYTFINAYVIQEKDNSYRAEFGKTESTSLQMGLTYEI